MVSDSNNSNSSDEIEIYLVDELCKAAIDTLEVYRENIKAGKYTDAVECLQAVRELTIQTQDIEDHASAVTVVTGNRG